MEGGGGGVTTSQDGHQPVVLRVYVQYVSVYSYYGTAYTCLAASYVFVTGFQPKKTVHENKVPHESRYGLRWLPNIIIA